MKKAISIILLAVLILTIAGCGSSGISLGFDDSAALVDSYRNSAQRLIDAGNYEGAAEVLKEGIQQTESQELIQMLDDVNRMMQNTPEVTVPVTEAPSSAIKPVPTEPPATVPPTEPVATQPPAPQSTPVSLSGIQRRINVFLSNFAETHFGTYPCEKHDMICFAFSHALLNNDGKINYANSEAYMSEKTVNNILFKYFGVTYATNSNPDTLYGISNYDYVRYDGSNYYIPAAAGEFYGYVAIAKEMMRNSDGTYTVKYDVYSLADMWEDDTNNYYNYTAQQARNSIKLDYCYSGVAIVKDYTRSDGNQSYHLLEMSRS